MPVAALIDDKILCMHGGLSPELIGYNQINDITKPQEVPDNGKFYYQLIFNRFIMWFTMVRSRKGH